MTRKQALERAIELMLHNPEYLEEAAILKEISEELPLTHWSDRSIRDTVEQFILDNGRVPTASDFKKKGMPPHTVIKQKYKMNLGRWLDENYPRKRPPFDEIKSKYTEGFLRDYDRIKPRSGEEFNKNRSPGTCGWQTIAMYYNANTWRKLLIALDLPRYFDMKKDHIHPKLNVNFEFAFED